LEKHLLNSKRPLRALSTTQYEHIFTPGRKDS
jgi:hypothetical protein